MKKRHEAPAGFGEAPVAADDPATWFAVEGHMLLGSTDWPIQASSSRLNTS